MSSSINTSHPTFTNQTVLITGATSGLGYAAALHFLQQDVGVLIITARTKAKGEETKSLLLQVTGADPSKLEVYELNLESTQSVVSFTKKLGDGYRNKLDAVVLNAGMYSFSWVEVEGNERSLQVNYLSNALLLVLLLPLLRSPKEGNAPCITIISSQMLAKAPLVSLLPLSGSIFEYLNDPKAPNTTGSARYGDTKLLVSLLIQHLSSLVDSERVVVNSLCPGAVIGTKLARGVPRMLQPLARLVQRMIMSTRGTDEASWEYLFAVSSKAGKETHGEFLVTSTPKALPSFVDTEAGKESINKLWKETSSWCEDIVPGCIQAAGLV